MGAVNVRNRNANGWREMKIREDASNAEMGTKECEANLEFAGALFDIFTAGTIIRGSIVKRNSARAAR